MKRKTKLKPENVMIQELPVMKLTITKSTMDFTTEHYDLEVKSYNLTECRDGILDLLYFIDNRKEIKKRK